MQGRLLRCCLATALGFPLRVPLCFQTSVASPIPPGQFELWDSFSRDNFRGLLF